MTANSALVRAQLSFGAAFAAEWAFTVALGIVAYEDGGATAVGLVGVLRLLPAGLLAPAIGALADRMPRERVLIGSSTLRGLTTLAAAAVLAVGGPVALVFALAVPSTIAFTPFRGAHSALLPSLARTPDELTRAMAVRGALDSVSLVVGPFAAAVLVAAGEVWTAFAFAGAAALVSSALLLRLGYERGEPPAQAPKPRLLSEIGEGVYAVRTQPGVALAFFLTTLQTFTRGALTVFVVVVAIELVDIGDAGVGWLQGAMGVGAILGSLFAARLIANSAMARWLAVGVSMWTLPLAAIGGAPEAVIALAALAVIGIGNAVLDVSVFTLLGRLVPDALLGRVFGVFEAIIAVTVAAGALVAPFAIEVLGVEGALVAFGMVIPAVALATWTRLRAIDAAVGARTEEIGLLRRVPMLRPLPLHAVEQIARGVVRVELPAGAEVFAAGDRGDRFYVIESGAVRILEDDALVRTMGPGEGFGEIALLRDCERTMTVRADNDVVLHAIERADFLPAVTGFGSAREVAHAAAERHLADAPGRAPART